MNTPFVNWVARKHGNAGTETGTGREMGTEITKRCGKPEPVSWPYSLQESQINLNYMGAFFNPSYHHATSSCVSTEQTSYWLVPQS